MGRLSFVGRSHGGQKLTGDGLLVTVTVAALVVNDDGTVTGRATSNDDCGIARRVRVRAIANMMMSTGNRPVVNTDIMRGKAAGKVMASVSNGFSLGMGMNAALRVAFMKCRPRSIGTAGDVGIILGRSGRLLSRIMIMNCKARGGTGLAKTMSAMSIDGALRTHPRSSISGTLRNMMPKLAVAGADKGLGDGPAVAVHNAKALDGDTADGPLVIMSNIPVSSVSCLGARSVSGVSILGSTTSASVCNAETTFNIVLMAAGSTGGASGIAVGCAGGFS